MPSIQPRDHGRWPPGRVRPRRHAGPSRSRSWGTFTPLLFISIPIAPRASPARRFPLALCAMAAPRLLLRRLLSSSVRPPSTGSPSASPPPRPSSPLPTTTPPPAVISSSPTSPPRGGAGRPRRRPRPPPDQPMSSFRALITPVDGGEVPHPSAARVRRAFRWDWHVRQGLYALITPAVTWAVCAGVHEWMVRIDEVCGWATVLEWGQNEGGGGGWDGLHIGGRGWGWGCISRPWLAGLAGTARLSHVPRPLSEAASARWRHKSGGSLAGRLRAAPEH